MTDEFVQAVREYFTAHPFSDDHLDETVLYAYDDAKAHRTFMTSSDENKDIALQIDNPGQTELIHICIDGGIAEYGLEDYQEDGQVHERCDCMVFSPSELRFVEFKMNMTSTRDKTVWRNCSDAMRAIRDFVTYFYRVFEQHGDSFWNYYPVHSASAIVCIKQSPNMAANRNSQRLTEKDKFTAANNLKVEFITQCECLS